MGCKKFQLYNSIGKTTANFSFLPLISLFLRNANDVLIDEYKGVIYN